MSSVSVIYAHMDFVLSYNRAVDEVARERSYLAFVEGFPLEASRSFVQSQISHNFPQYFAIDSEKVVGWCDVSSKPIPEYRHVGILGMGILKNYRGKGIGKRLIQQCIDHAFTQSGLEKIELTVFSTNSVALELYRSVGFEVEGHKKNSRKIDGSYVDEILMAMFAPTLK